MTPAQLQSGHFQSYPPDARRLAVEHIDLLRQLPIGFLPLLLKELIGYDYKFPVERRELDQQFAYLHGMDAQQLHATMRPFAQLHVSSDVERSDWVNAPVQFAEQLTAHLWATRQIDVFRAAAFEYVAKLNASHSSQPLPVHRLGVVVIGQGVVESAYPLFRKLRPHGVFYTAVDPSDGYPAIMAAMAARAAKHPQPYAHWQIDGANASSPAPGLTLVSYASLHPVRALLQNRIRKAYESGTGSEALRTALAMTRPQDVGLEDSGPAAVMNRFQLSLLTEGSGTQIFSTTFVQWAAREALRRAQPLTMLAHFTPRQREASSQQMLSEAVRQAALDPQGSLVDADMGAYYTWINQQRLPGAAEARFLVWFEGHREALVIAPGLQRGLVSSSSVSLAQLIGELV